MAIDATVGGANSNSYVTLNEANAYFAERIYADAWDVLVDQEQALVTATQRIDQEGFMGDRASETQALKWPRSGVYSDGVLIADTAIPQKVKDAQCELALTLAASNVLAPSDLAQFHSLSVGPISLVMKDGVVPSDTLPTQVARLLRGLREIPVLA